LDCRYDDLSSNERCRKCNKTFPIIWEAPNYLWEKITENFEGNILCPSCFDEMAAKQGISLLWVCQEFPPNKPLNPTSDTSAG